MRHLRTACVCCALVALAAVVTLAGREQGKAAFTVEITTRDGRGLAAADNSGLVGIEQTLVAKVTPAVEGAEYEWAVAAPVLRTYEHDAQKAEKHKPIALSEKDRSGPHLSFFWTRPQDGAEVRVRVRKGGEEATATAAFVVRLTRDPNRDVYSFADNDPRRNPNGLKATYAITKNHRLWHLGLKMDNGDTPVFAVMKDPAEKAVWGDVGYQRDPARMFGLDYNGGGLLGWHGAFLDAHRAWRRTFHVPLMDTAWPGGLPVPEYLKSVPDPKAAEVSRLYGYARAGEYQNLDQLGKDACHPWHNRGHTSISRVNNEPFMDDHTISPPGKNDLFFRWHAVVEEVRRQLGPDRAAVTATFPADGQTVGEAPAVLVAFDRKVSANAPAANTVQLAAGKVTVNGKPATAVADAGGDGLHAVVYKVTGFPAPADGAVKVELAGTAGYKGHTWTFTLKKDAKPAPADPTPDTFRRDAEKAFLAAREKQRKEDIGRLVAMFKAPDADDIWLGHLFRTYEFPAEEAVPLLVQLLDHPSDHVKGHATQLLQYRYGTRAKAAVPRLTALLGDKAPHQWWVREWAARALGVIAPGDAEVMAALVASIQNKQAAEPVNRGGIEVLGQYGPKAADALPLVRKYLTSPDPATAFAAYRAAGQIVNAAKPSADELKKLTAVDWKAADGGYAVFRAIEEAGSVAAFAAPALVATYRADPPTYVKAAVIGTLGKVKAGDAAAVQLLIDAVPARWGNPGDPPAEKFLSDLARDALQEISPSDPQAVPVLAKALGHADNDVRWQAAVAVKKYGPKGAAAVPALTEALKQSTVKLSTHQIGAYLDALRAIGPAAKPAGDAIVEMLSERSPLYKGQETFLAHYLQAYLLVTLADIGVPDGARPYILDLLNNSDIGTTHGYAAAARAAGALGPKLPEAVPGLARALKPEFTDFTMSFQRFCMALGPEDASCRLEALRALARIGPKAAGALPLVEKLAKEKPAPAATVPAWDEEANRTLRAIRGKE